MAHPLAHQETAPLDQVDSVQFDRAQVELHVFELAYLMALMQVKTVAALPDAVLFPKDPKVRSKMHSEGEKLLREGGWLAPNNGAAGDACDETLLSMAAAIADPRFTILTRRETPGGGRADATIYFNKVEIVEVTQIERQVFRLRRLADAPEAFQQVRKMLDVPARPLHAGGTASLRIETFQQVRRQAADGLTEEAAELMIEAGLSPEAAQDLLAALAAPQRKGIVSVLKHVAQKVTDVRVLGYYFRDSAAWLTTVGDERSQQVLVEAVDIEAFVRRLIDRVANVCA